MPPKSSTTTNRVRSRSSTATTNTNNNNNNINAKKNSSQSNMAKPSNSATRKSTSKSVKIIESNESKILSLNEESNLQLSQEHNHNNNNNNNRAKSPEILTCLTQDSAVSIASSSATKNGKNTNNNNHAANGGSSIREMVRARREQERKEKQEAEKKRLQEEQEAAAQEQMMMMMGHNESKKNSARQINDEDDDGVDDGDDNDKVKMTLEKNVKKSALAATAGGKKQKGNNSDAGGSNHLGVPGASLSGGLRRAKLPFGKNDPLHETTHLKKLIEEEVAVSNSFELVIKTVAEELAIRSNAVDDLATRLRQVLASVAGYVERRQVVRENQLKQTEKEVQENIAASQAALAASDESTEEVARNMILAQDAAEAAFVAASTTQQQEKEEEKNENNNANQNENNADNVVGSVNEDEDDVPLAAAAIEAAQIAAKQAVLLAEQAAKLAEQEKNKANTIAAVVKIRRVVAENEHQEKVQAEQKKLAIAQRIVEIVKALPRRIQEVSACVDKMEEEWKSDEMIQYADFDEHLVHPVAFKALEHINQMQGQGMGVRAHEQTELQKNARKAKLDGLRHKKEHLEKKKIDDEEKQKKREEELKKKAEDIKKKEEEKLAKKNATQQKKVQRGELLAAKQAASNRTGAVSAKKIVEDTELRNPPILDVVVYKPAPLGDLFPKILKIWVLLSAFCKTIKVAQMPLSVFIKFVVDKPFEKALIATDATVAKDICRGLCELILVGKERTEAAEVFDTPPAAKDQTWLLQVIGSLESELPKRAARAVKRREARRQESMLTQKQKKALAVKKKIEENKAKKALAAESGKRRRAKKVEEEEEEEDDDTSSEEDDSDDSDDEDEEEEENDGEEEEDDDDDNVEDDPADLFADEAKTSDENTNKEDDALALSQPPIEEKKLPEEIYSEEILKICDEIGQLKPVRWHLVSPGRRIAILDALLLLFLESKHAVVSSETLVKDLQVQSALLDKRLKDAKEDCEKKIKEINKDENLKDKSELMRDAILKATKKRDKEIADATSKFNLRYLKDSDVGFRALPIGRDRYKRLYWLFPMEGKVYVETISEETDDKFPITRVARQDNGKGEGNDEVESEDDGDDSEEDNDDDDDDDGSATLLKGSKNNKGFKNFDWELQSPLVAAPSVAVSSSGVSKTLLDDDDGTIGASSPKAGKAATATNNKKGAAAAAPKIQVAAVDPEPAEPFAENIWGFVPFECVKELTKQLDPRGLRESQLRKNLEKSMSMVDAWVQQHGGPVRTVMSTRSRAQNDGYDNRFRSQNQREFRSYF